MIEEEKAERAKQGMVEAAFIAWQTGESKMPFAKYLRQLGLSDDAPELTAEQKTILTAKGLSVADKIRAAVKAGKIA